MHVYSQSIIPSRVALPPEGAFSTVLEFLAFRFPRIPEVVWRERIEQQKVRFADGLPVQLDTPFQANRHVDYYREVINERPIPFQEQVLFENEHIVIADKPHFLPVHPAGDYVNETLITRLRTRYGYPELCNAHRIDRLTAGLVLCVKTREHRGLYQEMFRDGSVKKTYLAVGKLPSEIHRTHWHIQTRMESTDDTFRMKITSGTPVNSESFIKLIARHQELGLFHLQPITGKKHQLRVHLASIGSAILNDPFYSDYSDLESGDDFQRPMQLLAQRMEFIDPLSKVPMTFTSQLDRDLLALFPHCSLNPTHQEACS